MNNNSIDYDKWGHVTLVCQLMIAGFVFVTEVANNAILYVTRSQGYGPDTIVEKLLRYLVLTTVINFGSILISQLLVRKKKRVGELRSNEERRMILMIATILICTDVAYSHYQFSVALVVFVIPVMISILYEDLKFSMITFFLSMIGQTIAVYARAMDPIYNKDIGPEAAIAYCLSVCAFLFARMITRTLLQRRDELGCALVDAEKMNAAEERVQLSLKMLETLARALDAKDTYTNGHSARVAIYATKIAEELGWGQEAIDNLKYEALLHDIGKIGVPDSILNKPSRLNDIEFNLIKSHTLIGANILRDMEGMKDAKSVAKYHHERYDGMGYPKGIAGEEIPLNARIVCIADAYDAMSSDRIYRKALPPNIIREEFVKGRGSQFDPQLLDVFLKLFDENRLYARVETFTLSAEDTAQTYVMNDIEQVIHNISKLNQLDQSASSFDKFYIYMRNIGIRYNRSIEVLTVEMNPTIESDILDDEAAAEKMELAIKKNIRSVDVYYRYSSLKHFIIFLDAGVENVDVITQRIFFEFNNSEFKDKYETSYYLNENLQNESM